MLLGFWLFVLNWIVVGVLCAFLFSGFGSLTAWLIAPPLTQFLYIIPLWRATRREGKELTARGLLITACVMALLYGACSASIR